MKRCKRRFAWAQAKEDKKLTPKRVVAVEKPLTFYHEQQIVSLSEKVAEMQYTLTKTIRSTYLCVSVFLLMIFFQGSVSIVLNLYNLLIFFLGCKKFTITSKTEIIVFYSYTLLSTAQEFVITVLVYLLLSNEIKRTTCLVSKFFINARSDFLRNRLMQFIIISQANKSQFTLFDMYKLDGSLIKGIMSSTATYIIILLQYGIKLNDYERGVNGSNNSYLVEKK